LSTSLPRRARSARETLPVISVMPRRIPATERRWWHAIALGGTVQLN
jgi:hypothetical protein